MTAAEAKMQAAALALANLYGIENRLPYDREPERGMILAELRLIEDWLRSRACGGDKILLRQLHKPLGHQVKPPKTQQRALERLDARLRAEAGGEPRDD